MTLSKEEADILALKQYTHDYEDAAIMAFRGDFYMLYEVFQEQFEDLIKYDSSEDIMGTIVYRGKGRMIAYYDYERFAGAVL